MGLSENEVLPMPLEHHLIFLRLAMTGGESPGFWHIQISPPILSQWYPIFQGFFAVLGVGVLPRLFLELVMHRIQICGAEPMRQAPLDAQEGVAAPGLGPRDLDLIGMDKMWIFTMIPFQTALVGMEETGLIPMILSRPRLGIPCWWL